MASSSASSSHTLLDIISTCHNYPHPLFSSPTTDEYHAFHLHLGDTPTLQIGFIPRSVFERIQADDSATFVISPNHNGNAAVGLSPSLNNFQKRSTALNAIVRKWKDAGLFKSALDGWRNEHYAIYGGEELPRGQQGSSTYYSSSDPAVRSNTKPNPPAFELERAACALFGLVTFGVHLTAYTTTQEATSQPGAGTLHLWTPRRAENKATWPGYLDNSVAGGITSGDRPRQSMIRECWEEAGLTEEIVRPRLKQVGVITYVYRTPEGYLQPEVEYVYDLPLPQHVIPKPIDGEAQDFQLLDVQQVRSEMENGRFKPNCALVIIDFLIRHGVITAEDEPRYQDVVTLLHNNLAMPGP